VGRLWRKIEVIDAQVRKKIKSPFLVNVRYTVRVVFSIIRFLVYIICRISFLTSVKKMYYLALQRILYIQRMYKATVR